MEDLNLADEVESSVSKAIRRIHTSNIAKITKVNDTTVNCKIVLNQDNGEEFPEFIEVPVVTLYGGDTYRTYPIKENDYCLLFFNERCYDNWYNGEDNKPLLEYRLCDYSDGFALIGVKNKENSLKLSTEDTIIEKGNLNREGFLNNTGDVSVIGNSFLGKKDASKVPIVEDDMNKAIDNIIQGVSTYVVSVLSGAVSSPSGGPVSFPNISSRLNITKPKSTVTKVKVD